MKYAYQLPFIDLLQITEKNYYYSIKEKFLSNHDKYRGHFEINESDLKDDRKEDSIIASYEEFDPRKYYISNDGIYYFIQDFLVPSLEKSARRYIREIINQIRSIHNQNASINLKYFTDKKIVIRQQLFEADQRREFKRNGFFEPLKDTYEEILDKLNQLELSHFPKDKIHINLKKAEALLLFDALYKTEIITGITPRELARFAESNFSYKLKKDDYRDLTRAYDSLIEYLPTANNTKPRKNISEVSRERLSNAVKELDKYIDSIGGTY